jgi:hypothetical protein
MAGDPLLQLGEVRSAPAQQVQHVLRGADRALDAAQRIAAGRLPSPRGGTPRLTIAGKVLHRWVVIDMDATIITTASKKEGASATWKKSFGFHPLAAWCANTHECLAMLLRTDTLGNKTG